MAKNTHLTLEDRIIIEVSLKNGESFAEIGRKLEKDPSTMRLFQVLCKHKKLI